MAKVISRIVCYLRAWRKSFPEWFGVSALGESRFPNGLAFPRLAKLVSRMVCYFRAWRKSFPGRFVISALGECHFPNSFVLTGLPQIIPQKVCYFRTWRKSFLESWMVMYLAMKEGVVILVEFYGKEMFLNLSH